MNKTSKIALGIVGAAAAGVVIGMLISPEKGKDLRKTIKKTANKWVDQVGNIFSHAEQELDDLKSQARTAKASTMDKVNKLKEEYSS